MKSVRVTVIIPNFNHGAYLAQRIESVIRQTYKDFGIVLMDDYSSDNSRDILSLYRNHPRVEQIVLNENNSGSPFQQWRRGVEISKGQLIWVAESDDVADPNFLERVSKPFLADKNQKISFCYCNSKVINSQGIILGEYFGLVDAERPPSETSLDSDEFITKFLLHSNSVPNASAVIFRKEKSLGVFDEVANYKINGDWLFWLRLSSMGKVVYINEPLNLFRTHEFNVRSSTYRNGVFLPELFNVQKHAAYLLRLNSSERRMLKYNMLNRFYREVNYNNVSISHKLRKECFSIINEVSPGVFWPAFRTRIRLRLDKKL